MPKNVMCKNCNNYRNNWCEKVCDEPDPKIVRDCRYFWQMTNGDIVRAMNDEELAKLFASHEYEVAKTISAELGIDITTFPYDFEEAEKEHLEQLRQPAKEEE